LLLVSLENKTARIVVVGPALRALVEAAWSASTDGGCGKDDSSAELEMVLRVDDVVACRLRSREVVAVKSEQTKKGL
jgi:hypothetical protein